MVKIPIPQTSVNFDEVIALTSSDEAAATCMSTKNCCHSLPPVPLWPCWSIYKFVHRVFPFHLAGFSGIPTRTFLFWLLWYDEMIEIGKGTVNVYNINYLIPGLLILTTYNEHVYNMHFHISTSLLFYSNQTSVT